MSGLGRGEEVVRRGAEARWDARCCVKVGTRRLLLEQIAAVVVLERGQKNDAMWHVPHRDIHCGHQCVDTYIKVYSYSGFFHGLFYNNSITERVNNLKYFMDKSTEEN